MRNAEAEIERRIRAGLAKVRCARGVRAIYLNPEDRAQLDDLATKRWGSGARVHRFDFDDHPIIGDGYFDGHTLRPGRNSRIYDRSGVAYSIPPPAKRKKGERDGRKIEGKG